ncbi:unnamed protein product [Plutella xylostella]|uniref:(diamondback moth) hypothetical protein n=1 Tax=Plutella xylostella TaxID=51655 RepID=A0A8S4E6S1_PLUXY|nr:unnamed protein product [Plutella xylostella]
MLETDEVDDDYFTPLSSTSLANIFSKPTDPSEENSSLKYVPPKPAVGPKPEDVKNTECVLACALFAYEWYNNVYTSKGKLGFAIMKILKTGVMKILLYDSNKVTLSCTTIQPSLNVKRKGDTYLSFYDNAQKYWSVCGTSQEIDKIVDTLQNCNVTILHMQDEPKPRDIPDNLQKQSYPMTMESKDTSKGSDTDSSMNRKTKASILSRMASMGHSILPPQRLTDRTSDSSDTNETEEHHKVIRHKPTKSIGRKPQEKISTDSVKCSGESQNNMSITNMEAKPEDISYLTLSSNNLLPLPSTNIISTISTPNDMSLLMSEQRMSNSEIRMNIGRLSDKVDNILDKFNDLRVKETSANNCSIEIYQKLLSEYENKIKLYEEVMKANGLSVFDLKALATGNDSSKGIKSNEIQLNTEIENLRGQVRDLKKSNDSKDEEILELKKDINLINCKQNEVNSSLSKTNEQLMAEIRELKIKSEDLKKCESDNKMDTNENKNTGNRIKGIMNDTYQLIAASFENNDTPSYSGSHVRSTVAAVIKKVTLEVLKE